MGTINYGGSEHITLGFDCWAMDEATLEVSAALAEEYIDENESWLYYMRIKPGYYEGAFLSIEYNYGICFDDSKEKQEAQKEVTRIKKALKGLADRGMVAVSPGWCTAYYTYEETCEMIDAAIKQMREEARTTPTWLWYERDQHCASF